MINVCFAGITCWTAPPILAAIDDADDLSLTAGVSRSAAGQDLATPTGLGVEGRVFRTIAEALTATPVDVVVDYTSAEAVRENAWAAVEAGVHVVIGSSGLTAADYAELDQLARDRGVGVVAAGNFSVMAAVLQRVAGIAAQHLEHWEVIDYASDDKPDVPSGTSRELAETLGALRRPKPAVPLSELHGPVEARGAEVDDTASTRSGFPASSYWIALQARLSQTLMEGGVTEPVGLMTEQGADFLADALADDICSMFDLTPRRPGIGSRADPAGSRHGGPGAGLELAFLGSRPVPGRPAVETADAA